VVGSAVGGIKTTVVDGETGFLVPPKDPETLADRLGDVLGDPDLRREMGRRAIGRVNRRYTWRSVARRVANLYEDALRARPASARTAVRPIPSTTAKILARSEF